MQKCKVDGCENPATGSGDLCEYHELKKKSERTGILKTIGKGLVTVTPIVLSGVALFLKSKGSESKKKGESTAKQNSSDGDANT